MNSSIENIDWPKIFSEVIKKDTGALKWGLPEPWVHAELFCTLTKEKIPWTPFPDEVPYITYYPVTLPKITNRNWKKIGAVKYVDICLKDSDKNEFIWLEFKVRNTSFNSNTLKANVQSMDAFKKDIVALIGFSKELTSSTWHEPDVYTRSYKFEKLLTSHHKDILSANHRFVSCYLHLEEPLLDEIWERKILTEKIESWLDHRRKESEKKIDLPKLDIGYYKNLAGSPHTLIICQW